MKLVLAGSVEDFERFKQVLWRKDKDVSGYVYINTPDSIRGYNRDTQVIKLASFINHQYYTEILDMAQPYLHAQRARRTHASRSNPYGRSGFESAGMVPAGGSLTADMLDDARDRILESSGVPPEQLRGLHTDQMWIDEFNGLRDQLDRTHQDSLIYGTGIIEYTGPPPEPIRGVTPPSAMEYRREYQAEWISREDLLLQYPTRGEDND